MSQQLSNDEKLEKLAQIVRQSAFMLECARAGDWVAVQDIEKIRKQGISEFFAIPAPKELEKEVAKALRVLVETEIQLVELSASDHIDFQKKLEMFQKAQNASNQYKKHE